LSSGEPTGIQEAYQTASIVETPTIAAQLTAEQRNAILNTDFRGFLEQCQLESGPPVTAALIKQRPELAPLLGTLRYDGKEVASVLHSAALVGKFEQANGRLPKDASELFASLRTEQGFMEFQNMDPKERFVKYALAINRATGKFYTSFEQAWNPGGLTIKQQEVGPDIVKKVGSRTVVIKEETDVLARYQYKIFGTAEKEVVLTDIFEWAIPE
jgi:hypothetical protein